MIIKSLAKDLYRAQQNVHQLQEKLEQAELKHKETLKRELREAEAERDQLRRMVDSRKEKLPFRTSFRDT